MKVQLGPADRERYGLDDEPLDVDITALRQSEAEVLDEHGIDPDRWSEFVAGEPVLDGHGRPVMREDQPDLPQRHRPSAKAWRALVWIALRRNGQHVDFADVDFDRRALRYQLSPAEGGVAEPGKAEEPSETSESPTPVDSSPGSG